MTINELTPEATAMMKKLVHNPQPLTDIPTLQLLVTDRVMMGS